MGMISPEIIQQIYMKWQYVYNCGKNGMPLAMLGIG